MWKILLIVIFAITLIIAFYPEISVWFDHTGTISPLFSKLDHTKDRVVEIDPRIYTQIKMFKVPIKSFVVSNTGKGCLQDLMSDAWANFTDPEGLFRAKGHRLRIYRRVQRLMQSDLDQNGVNIYPIMMVDPEKSVPDFMILDGVKRLYASYIKQKQLGKLGPNGEFKLLIAPIDTDFIDKEIGKTFN